MSTADHAGKLAPSPKEEAIQFLMAHEQALEEGKPPPDLPQNLLDRLDPAGRARLLQLLARQRRLPARPDPPPEGAAVLDTLPAAVPDDRPLPAVPGYVLLGELG